MSGLGKTLKRGFDIALSSVLLLVFSPLIGICALAVFLEDGKPVIYRQERMGLGGKPFDILKFRSMRLDAEAAGPALYSGDEDPRLTKVGKFLRQHHLDELPQLWNVLCGDMSFIGYRPERQFYIDQIMAVNPRYRYLYQIRPGVTSYATLYNGYTDSLEKMLTRLDLDLYYLRNHSVWFDARVLGLTFLSIVGGKKF
ncbi:MAG: sugar transferase [Bacteroidales bacterium]|nr:sugar transferase [Bacteroidales bacterium]